MKKRHGFVSNSSSSSFICDICHRKEEGFDLDIEDAGMLCCENGHTFCVEHAVNVMEPCVDPVYYFGQYYTIIPSLWYVQDKYCVPAKYCPICSKEHGKHDSKLLFHSEKEAEESLKDFE